MKRIVFVGMVLGLGLGQARWCPAADWPRWRGPDGTGHVPAGAAVPQTLPAEPPVVWRTRVGDGVGSPVVSGGKVFYLDNQQAKETVHAVDAASGKELWNATLDDVFEDFQSKPGPRTTPVVDGDRVYVQSCRGEFQCLAVADGKPIWRVNFVKDFGAVFIGEKGDAVGAVRHGYAGPPWVDGDRLLVGVGGREGASVVCFDKRDGRVLWKSQNDVPGYDGPIVATLAGAKQVVSFTAEGVIGLAADDGALAWRFPVKTAFGRHVTTPVVVGDIVLVASHTAGLMGIRVAKQGGGLQAEQAWLAKNLACNFSDPVAVGPYLYGLGPGNLLFCADARTGEKAWGESEFFSGMLEKGWASFIVMHDKILVLAERGQLLLVAADPKACRILGKAEACGKNWCNPAYADGRLYLRDAQELRCLRLLP